MTLATWPFTVGVMTTDSTTRVLDAGRPLFLHERPPYDPMPPCGRGVCVEMPATAATDGDSLLVSIRRIERHDGGPALAELERSDVVVSLATAQCAARSPAAERLLAECPWIAAALASQIDPLRRRAWRLLAQRDRSSYRSALDHAKPGAMVPYDRLFPHDWDMIVGRGGLHYWASDLHCHNLACDCREITVMLYDLSTRDAPTVGDLRIDLRSGDPRSSASSPLASRLFQPLWAQYGAELNRRHDEVRQAVVAYAASRHERTSPAPTGRNAPCPCGSGVKFKRCCALRGVTAAAPRTGPAR